MPGPRRFAAGIALCVFTAWMSSAVVKGWQQPPGGQQQQPPAAQQSSLLSTVVTPEDEQAVKALVAAMYDARVKKDVQAFAALWHPNAPRRPRPQFPANFVFPYDTIDAGAATVSRTALKWGTLSARVSVPVTIRLQPNEQRRSERWVRNLQFLRDGDAWKIYSESPAAEDLALEIGRAQTDEARQALLDSEPDLVNEELALALETQGDRQAVGGNLGGAPAFYTLELQIGEKVGSRLAVARGHLKIGQLLVVRPGPKEDAIEHFKKALDVFTALDDRPRIAAAERGLGTAYYMNDDQASREHYMRALAILETLPDKVDLAGALHAYGNACFMAADYGAALDAYRRSMSLLESAGTKSGIPALYQAIGRAQKEQRDYDAAVESYMKSMSDPGNLDPTTHVIRLTGIADVFRLQGRFELALEQYGTALQLVSASNDVQMAMTIEADIGNVYMSEQQPPAALSHYSKSLELARQLNNPNGVARALAGSGTALFADLRYEAALDAYTQSLALREKMNDKPSIAWTHAHIGLVQSALDKHEEALASFQKAYDLSTSLRDNAAVAVMQTLIANEHAELDQPDRALEMAGKAAAVAQAIGSDDTLAQARTVAARVLRKKGDRAGAERLLVEAIGAVESNRARSGDEPRDDFFGDMRGPYRLMALLKAETASPADALLYAELSQVGLLTDLMAGNRLLIRSGLTDQEQEDERALNREVRSLRLQLDKERQRPTPDQARLDSLNTAFTDADRRRTAFLDKLYTDHPSLKLQRALFRAGSTDEIAALIPDARTALVEFVTTDKQTLAIVATKNGASPMEVTTATIDLTLLDVAKRVREFRTVIRERDKQVNDRARALFDAILAPLADRLAGRTRLLIVPDGPLWGVPFQALQMPDGRFLIERASVSYASSLTAAQIVARQGLASTPRATTRRVIAVGNRQAASAADRLKLLNPATDLKPIPNAEQEARKLQLLYGVKRTKVYAGTSADAQAARRDAREAAVLHLATFFVPSPASPLRSLFVVATRPDNHADLAEACELMDSGVPPVTVVSRTQAERISGEGQVPVGVSWSFFVGGAQTAVLPSWPDDSLGAVAVMTGLHRALARPTGALAPAGALRQAVLPLLATQYRHPFYWANYTVVGVDWKIGNGQ